MSDGPGQDTNKYIKIVYSTANFDGEKKYEGIGFPDKAFRLLFLSRFWNIINYFAPYKYLTTPWDDVLERFIPPFINANNTEALLQTLQGLSKSLNDGHSQLALNGQMLSNAFFGAYTTPFYCEIIDRQVVIRNTGNDSIAKSLNIQRGDVVLNVDGKEVSKIMAYGRSYISASNSADEDHQLSRFILDGPTPTVALELFAGGQNHKNNGDKNKHAKQELGAVYKLYIQRRGL